MQSRLRSGSAALVADGLHARTDGFTSLAVVFSAVGIWLGFPIADPIVGLLITLAILMVLRDAAREVYRRLMDAVDPHLVDETQVSLVDEVGGVERDPRALAAELCRGEPLEVRVDPLQQLVAGGGVSLPPRL